MSESTTCGACGTEQAAGSAFCAICGTAFPRTGRPYPAAPVRSAAPFHEQGIAITTEREVAAMTQRATGLHTQTGAPAPSGLAQAPSAGVGRRFVAFLIDCALVALVAVVAASVTAAVLSTTAPSSATSQAAAQDVWAGLAIVYAVAALVCLACWVAVWVWEGRTGRTLGNLALGLRTVGAQDRAPLGFGRAALRWIVTGLGSLVLGVGQILVALSPAFDGSGRRQGWQDKAAKALVLDVRTVHGVAPAGAARPVPGAPASAPPAGFAPPGAVRPAESAPAASFAPPRQAPGSAAGPAATGPAGPAPLPVEDPWAFPAPAPAQGPGTPTGLITGIPGSAPAQATPTGPAPAPGAVPAGPGPTAPAAPAPVSPSAQGASGALAADEDPEWDSTRLSVSDLRREPLAAEVGVVLELASGRQVPVTGRALVGRNPAPTGAPDEVLVRVEDPTRSVSKTHAELVVDQGSLWLTDRGSTNGTILTRPGSPPQVLEAGVRVAVPVGSVVQVGDQRVDVRPGVPS